MVTRIYHTSDLARIAGVHPNTVRLYEKWGLIPPVERSESGYRLFTQDHLDCLCLARTIYSAPYPGKILRASGYEIIRCAVNRDWQAALQKALDHRVAVKAELAQAETAADLLEHWAQTPPEDIHRQPLAIREVSEMLGVSQDALRNWERNGLIRVRRNAYNNYRLFGKKEIERLRIIRMLSRAGYSHMAILRMFIELDAGNTQDLREVLDTPRPDEDLFTAADRWLTTLHEQEDTARRVILMVEEIIASR